MLPRRLLVLGAVGALLMVGSYALAAEAPPPCAPVAPCAPEPQYVEKTILCPEWVTETQMCCVTECRLETRQVCYTVCRQIPETKEFKRECTIMVPQVRTRPETVMVCKPVWQDVSHEVTVMVPHTEMQPVTHEVCRLMPVKQMKTVCEDQGHWEDRPGPAPGPCDPCGPAQTLRCWVPKIVEKQVEVTCMQPTMVTETCQRAVIVCRPEKRICTTKVCHYEQVPVTRQVCYTECVPKKIVRTEYVTTCRCVEEQVVRNITVPVPVTVQKPVQVQVCKMVPKTIKVPVSPCCQPCCRCAKHCHRG